MVKHFNKLKKYTLKQYFITIFCEITVKDIFMRVVNAVCFKPRKNTPEDKVKTLSGK